MISIMTHISHLIKGSKRNSFRVSFVYNLFILRYDTQLRGLITSASSEEHNSHPYTAVKCSVGGQRRQHAVSRCPSLLPYGSLQVLVYFVSPPCHWFSCRPSPSMCSPDGDSRNTNEYNDTRRPSVISYSTNASFPGPLPSYPVSIMTSVTEMFLF